MPPRTLPLPPPIPNPKYGCVLRGGAHKLILVYVWLGGDKQNNRGSAVTIALELDAEMKAALTALESIAQYKPPSAAAAAGGGGAISLSGGGGHFKQMRIDDVKKTATVSLNDCLACRYQRTSHHTTPHHTHRLSVRSIPLIPPPSVLLHVYSGCVTSAETVLITAQSSDEFLTKLKAIRAAAAADSTARPRAPSGAMDVSPDSTPDAAAHKLCVITLSPHSRTALSNYFAPGGSELSTAKRLTTLFHRIGIHAVFDATVGLDIALIEARNEFVTKFRAATAAANKPSAAGGGATVGTATTGSGGGGSSGGDTKQASSPSVPVLPLLAGECPGWVCYAEKKEGKTVLPHIATTKSPQQIMGVAVKSYLAPKWNVSPGQIYHVCVMPCYDKKLEGARDDHFDPVHNTRDVDCVLTTDEIKSIIIDVLRSNATDTNTTATAQTDQKQSTTKPSDDPIALFGALSESALDALNCVSADQSVLFGPVVANGTSGGYLDHIYRYAAKELFGVDIPSDKPLHFTATRNPDMKEIDLKVWSLIGSDRIDVCFGPEPFCVWRCGDRIRLTVVWC